MSSEPIILSPPRAPIFMSPPRVGFRSTGEDTFSSFEQNTPGQMTPGCPELGSPPSQSTPYNLVLSSPEYRNVFSSPPYTPDDKRFGVMQSPMKVMKRGRPRASQITSLIVLGSTRSEGVIKCQTCYRVFPRDKSLQAHLRTHTGERPYVCDYPDCTKKFCQSGQLKTHQRLHSREKPFKCSTQDCQIRFTHANRRCPDHPASVLVRDEDNMPVPQINDSYTSPAIQIWLEKYMAQRQDRTPPNKFRMPLTQPGTKRSLHNDLENQYRAAKRLESTDITGCAELSDCDDVGANESFFEPRQILYEPENKNYSCPHKDDNVQSLGGVHSSSDSSMFGDVSLKSKGFQVSVIRHAPVITTNQYLLKSFDQYLSPKKEFVNIDAARSPIRPCVERNSDSLSTMSPMKSPRKAAALALIDLINVRINSASAQSMLT